MKYNNGTTTNMANVFGSQFDLSTEEIINIIRKMYNLKVVDLTFNPIEVEVALYNNDYYVRPGIAKESFMNELMKLFAESKLQEGKVDDNLLHFRYTILSLNVMKKFFDEAYFKEQVEKRKRSESIVVNKDKLRMYLKKLDRDKLESFLETMIICRRHHGLFISDINSVEFWTKIYDACRAAGINVPEDFDSVEGQRFMNDSNNKGFYFNVLSTKVIANMLCDAIDLDVAMASSAAKKLYTSGSDAMIHYIYRKISA